MDFGTITNSASKSHVQSTYTYILYNIMENKVNINIKYYLQNTI